MRRSFAIDSEDTTEIESEAKVEVKIATESTDKNVFSLLNIIEINHRQEYDAIQEYYELLSYSEKCFERGIICDKTLNNIKDNIFEIIGDELNHSEKLKVIAYKLSNISPNLN